MQLLSAKATFVIEVTRSKRDWSELSAVGVFPTASGGAGEEGEPDMFASPEVSWEVMKWWFRVA
jgi:hypothetical protein